uniref:Leucine rich immune protein (Coil-less) n=1 Tax=Anopheles farauti TaxID=69004 RepID=A0A182QUT4_9DIPT
MCDCFCEELVLLLEQMLVLCFFMFCMLLMGIDASNFTYIKGNVSCTIIGLTNGEGKVQSYDFLTNSTEELVFKNASIDVLDLTVPMEKVTSWKLLISDSNATRIIFPAQMSPSMVHLVNVGVDDLQFEENTNLQDFRVDYATLPVISPTVSKLAALDILWVTHSALANFSFEVLENSSISLLYLVANKIETVTIAPGLRCCENLEEIFLSDNKLKTLDLATFAFMSKLKTLFVENNQLVEVYTNLDTNHNQTFEVGGNGTRQFCSWRSYYLQQDDDSSIDEAPTPNCTDYFSALLSMQLARNHIVTLNFRTFSLMNSLNSLDLSSNRLVNLVASEDEVPVRLSELFVSNNNISDIQLAKFVSLKALYMYDNSLTKLNMSSLPVELDYLNLVNNPLNCSELPHMNRSTNLPSLGPYTEC